MPAVERRTCKRKRGVDGMVTVAPGLFGWLTGTDAKTACSMLDIGEKGMCLVSRDPACAFSAGQKVAFQVKARGITWFTTRGRVAWVRPWEKGRVPLDIIGVEFEGIDGKTLSAIRHYLHPHPRARAAGQSS